ncbi:MAG: hypothetical protein QOK11_3309, partial [Pseudonocardiales bacterium]|nr:hypothetical protein [Pseudonocardiales bacterium]
DTTAVHLDTTAVHLDTTAVHLDTTAVHLEHAGTRDQLRWGGRRVGQQVRAFGWASARADPADRLHGRGRCDPRPPVRVGHHRRRRVPGRRLGRCDPLLRLSPWAEPVARYR